MEAHQVRSNVKVLLTIFFDCNDVVHHELLPQDRMVNKEYYLEVMRRLRKTIRQKRTELWKNQSWILYNHQITLERLLMMLAYCSAYAKQFLCMF